jgi:hypothetical protein
MYSRDWCVLCENEKLEELNSLDLSDKKCTIRYGRCIRCSSVQLIDLLEPSIVYDGNYVLPDYVSYNWVRHNISFINFIVKCVNTCEPLIEIGSSSFVLGKHLIEYYKDYTVFDYSLEQAKMRPDVKYIEGNCENFDFPPDSTIIMSHVFEHLYEPKKFIENCKRNQVKNIIIAVPNMESHDILHVTYQHTFMYSENDIEYIFGLQQYKMSDKYRFNTKDESFPVLFFHFELSDNVIGVDRCLSNSRHLYIENMLKKIRIPENTIIATAGQFSEMLYALIENKENLIAVIDNNKKLQGKKFIDSDLLIHSYEFLVNLKNCNIILHHPRKIDIISCIKKYNNYVNIISL